MGLVRENIYLYNVQVSTCLVDVYEDCICFGEVSFFVMLKVSKWNGAVIKFCVKLKKRGTEMFGMLKSTYGEECLSRAGVFEWHTRFKEGQELLQDDERKGCPSISRTEELTEVIQKCLAKDQTLSILML
jgi:hypothetical protein